MNKPRNLELAEILRDARIIPVLTVRSWEGLDELAATLIDNGLSTLEITLRSPIALEVIQHLRRQFPRAVVGAGTLLGIDQIADVLASGAMFAVSPGVHYNLVKAMEHIALPFLPGATTASEMMQLMEAGYMIQKFFPARTSGGCQALKLLAGPLPDLRFCATGGLGMEDISSYLAEPNCLALGGSWMAPGELVRAGRWQEIGQLARQSMAWAGNHG